MVDEFLVELSIHSFASLIDYVESLNCGLLVDRNVIKVSFNRDKHMT